MKTLIFTPHGTALLMNGTKQLWASDADDDFAEQQPNEFLDANEDDEFIIDYLIDEGFLTEDEELDIDEQSLTTDDEDEGDDDE